MICDKCGFSGDFIEESFGQYIITYCPECHYTITSYCKHEDSGVVKYSIGSSFRVQMYCLKCHKLHGSALKQAQYNLSDLKEIPKEKHDKYHEERGNKYSSRLRELSDLQREWNKKEWLDEHNSYLRSEQWRDKREQALIRDNYLCQACLCARATEVHHLSYAHWRNEPLFELVSICNDCHKLITKLDNAKNHPS